MSRLNCVVFHYSIEPRRAFHSPWGVRSFEDFCAWDIGPNILIYVVSYMHQAVNYTLCIRVIVYLLENSNLFSFTVSEL